jgi:2'-hydroxyisoflavone reductase
MRLLILGGTLFLGRQLVEVALARGHQITLFNRGQRNPELFPDVEKLRGNRDGGLDALKGRRWDAVIDTCGYVPRVVRDSAQILEDAVDHYTFISSISVYSDLRRPGVDESGALGTLEDPTVENVDAETYGPLKVLCEQAVEDSFPNRALLIRPGLIVGPHDPSDRFTYWPHRVSQDGEILVPEPKDLPTQFIDVRDLAEWTIDLVEARRTGPFNATGPRSPLPFESLLNICRMAAGSEGWFTWVDPQWLRDRGVEPGSFHFWWIPPEEEGFRSAFQVDCSRAIAAGLTFRPAIDTVKATLDWHRTRGTDYELKHGLSADRERELLEEWHDFVRE